MKRHTINKLILLHIVFSLCSESIAQEEYDADKLTGTDFKPVWYLGLAGGNSSLAPEGDSAGFVPVTDSDSGAKFFFGQKFKPKWSWEIGYTDAGSVQLESPNPLLQALIPDAGLDYRIVSAFLNYYLNTDDSRFNAYAKLGVSSITTTPSDSRINVNNDASTPLAVGLGAEMRFGQNWFVRLEHDNYSKDAAFSNLALGFRFGGSSKAFAEKSAQRNRLPVVIEYPIYIPEEQVEILSQDSQTVAYVADELREVSEELRKASTETASAAHNQAESERLVKQAEILAQTSDRITIVEESIARTAKIDINSIDKETFKNDKGEPLLLTPAEQSAELGIARRDIGRVEKAVEKYPFARQRLSRVRGRIAVVEESLLFVPPWEKDEASALCNDFAEKAESIHFQSESTRLTKRSEQILNTIATKMNRNYRVIMEIHAHTDSWGTFAFNQQLSEARAQQAVDYLVEQGVARARLVAMGFGELKPLDKNDTRPGRASNRRIEFIIKNPNICK